MNYPYLSSEISKIIMSAERPEFNLSQLYEASSNDQKIEFVCALIGKVIEQDRMLRGKFNKR
ncbi:hypothetical protein A936_09013 [Enterobacter sp. Ag1]|nr:hypothetical protein A936_09013 [Enterobacter sp. Ag1]